MRTLRRAAALVLAAVPAIALAQSARLAYPDTPRGEVVDTYWGTRVADPYRWLEDVESPQTKAWLAAENALTRSYLDAIPQRAAIRAAYRRMTAQAVSEPAAPEPHGRWWTEWRTPSGTTRQVLYARDGAHGAAHVVLDTRELDPAEDIAYRQFSPSGRYFAYGTQTHGSEWITWRVRDVATGHALPDIVRWTRYVAVSFAGDVGFYYSGYDAPADPGKMAGAALGAYKAFFHRLGTAQSDDMLIRAGKPASNEFPATRVTPDGAYAMLLLGALDANGYAVFPAGRPGAQARLLIAPGDGRVVYVANVGSRFFFLAQRHRSNGSLVEVDARDPEHRENTLVASGPDTLVDASVDRGRIYLDYLHDVHNVFRSVDLAGRHERVIAPPGVGTAAAPRRDEADGRLKYAFESFTQPVTTYVLDPRTARSTALRPPAIRFDSARYVTEQIFATSKDGTRIPVFVTYRRGTPRDGSAPVLLYGYGGWSSLYTLTPNFSFIVALWLEMGGTYAVVNTRGGGEYGEAWHRAGMLANKQHVFDDAIAAAEMLIARRYTSKERLALRGGSEGGLMAAAVATQRPDLFAAVLPDSGIQDMLRFQRFNSAAASAAEDGSSDQSEAAFRTLYAYSPLHNVREGTRYPAMMITAGDHDDRVFPAHSYKLAAALQHAQAGDAPILLRVGIGQGHWGPRTPDEAADAIADRYAFLVKALGFTPTIPPG